ncbi:MAG: hypothetical protein U0L53_04090, partial [Bacteroidales bacterium]|nr:hypothetical protein [Bacteroidales bacterium]
LKSLKSAKFQIKYRKVKPKTPTVISWAFLISIQGNCGTSNFDKKNVPRFYFVLKQRKKVIKRLWDRGNVK